MRNIAKLARLRRDLPSPDSRRAIRVAAGVSLEDVAREVGVTRSAVARWERGDRSPGREHIAEYSRVLHELKDLL